jgi:putative phosphoribosyl transferase
MAATTGGPFADRREAGRALAQALDGYRDRDDLVVLALPRGGVPVAAPVADALGAPLDVLIVRKLGLPGHPELAMGAVGAVGDSVEVVRNRTVLDRVQVSDEAFDDVRRREVDELHRREQAYRGDRPAVRVRDRVVLVVDDGLATGSTMRAALTAVRQQQPARVVVAVPVAARDTCTALRELADDVVCPWQPEPFYAVGQGYVDFRPTEDSEVQALLAEREGRS